MKYKYKPKTKDELKEIIEKEIEIQGKNADLNMIDTSLITDMCCLFVYFDFNGDISQWDVSNVKDMHGMFEGTKFNGDISEWDVSNVTDMSRMFAYSKFNQDISKWNVSNVKDMSGMFEHSMFKGDIFGWDVSNVRYAERMLYGTKISYKMKLVMMLRLSMNDVCDVYEIIEGFDGKKGDDLFEFILNNYNQEDICYAFEKADIPYEKISHLLKKLLKIDCLFDIYPELHGEMINDILSV